MSSSIEEPNRSSIPSESFQTPPALLNRKHSFQLVANAVISNPEKKCDTSDYESENISQFPTRRRALNSILKMDYKKDCIKEEEEPPDHPQIVAQQQSSNRIRKTNDRLFRKMPIKIPSFDELNAPERKSLVDTTLPSNSKYPFNPRINIEKSLGSVECPNLYSPSNANPELSLTVPGSEESFVPRISSRQRKLSMPVASTTSLELPVTLKPRERSASPAR